MFGSKSLRRSSYVAVLAALLAAMFTLTAAQAVIPPSTFEGSDGDLDVDAAGNVDWDTLADVVTKDDAASGQSDPSLKGDEGSTTPEVTAGSVQGKADLLDYRVGRQTAGGKDFLLLGWRRLPDTGTVNFDFELNQLPQGAVPAPSSSGTPWPLNRTKGDLLFTFDLAQGGVTPTLSMLTWQTDPGSTCGASQWSVPCWGEPLELNPASTPAAEAGVGKLPDGKIWFGEASINLQDAGIFKTGVCTNFGSAYAKSRSSDSPSASLSDFIAPTAVSVNNCGDLTIVKNTGADDGDFSFDVDCSDNTFDRSNLGVTTSSGTGSVVVEDIPNGTTCTVTEDAATGWTLTATSPDPASVTINGGKTVTFTNSRDKGKITVAKTATGGDGTFTFTVACPSVTGYPKTLTITTASGTGNATTGTADIPTGTTCTVTEGSQPGVWTTVGDVQQTVLVDSANENVVFANARDVGTLTVVVKTEGGNGTFPYTVDCDGAVFDAAGSITTVSGTGSAPAIIAIPTGTNCTASQAPQPGWTLTSTNPQSTVIDGDEVLTFVNRRNVNSIAIDKTSSTASATSGHEVTYTYVVTTPGPDSLAQVTVTDDKCSPVAFVSGDTDGDGLLDPGETWRYTCVSPANAAAPTNIAIATGVDPAGATVQATDQVTISVIAPTDIPRAIEVQGVQLPVRLPKTGSDTIEWALLGGSLVLLGFSFLFVSGRRRQA